MSLLCLLLCAGSAKMIKLDVEPLVDGSMDRVTLLSYKGEVFINVTLYPISTSSKAHLWSEFLIDGPCLCRSSGVPQMYSVQ